MIGAGIFALPAALVASAGRLSLVVLLVAFVLVSLMALCTVEVASRYEVTGGPMYYRPGLLMFAHAAFDLTTFVMIYWNLEPTWLTSSSTRLDQAA